MAQENSNLKSEAALREEKILEFWKENKIFDKSLAQSEGKKEFIFYEGPPTANAKPALHHLAARAFKDAIPRYKTMRGYRVRRKAGWDTHGLPVELQVEKKLGLNSKKAIEEYGIAKFNKECRESVWEHVGMWGKFTDRIGYWVDQENPYVTYHNEFIESVWNIVKKTDEQGLLYKDYRIVPWCPRCGTALSSHELAQGYEDVKDLSVTAKFKVKGQDNTYILAWTTTPWTLPGNVALAVGEDVTYVKISIDNENYILAKDRLVDVFKDNNGNVKEFNGADLKYFKGKDLIGLEYEPLFPYLAQTIAEAEKSKLEKSYKVYGADFVTTEDGTGVVHTAVMYGQDDFVLGTKLGLPKHHLVGLDGKFLPGTGIFEGRFVKDEEVAVDIIKDLAHRGLLFKKEKYEHSYPHCWRCKTPLIYYARDSWYIKMSDPKVKGKMIAENKQINWEPPHIRDGRFGEWLREIKDWAISRERYWGTPLPVWETADKKEKLVISSVADLRKYAKRSGNKYLMLRHGESEKNVKNISDSTGRIPSPLTPVGEATVKKSAELFKKEKIDYIFASPLLRAEQTSKIVGDTIGLPVENIITDERLTEVQTGEFDGKSIESYTGFYAGVEERFTKRPKDGENLVDVKKRTGNFIYELEEKYKDKNILIVSHEDAIWMLESASFGLTNKQSIHSPKNEYIKMGEVRELDFAPLPVNEDYELDLHKPFIDNVILVKDGKEFKRTKEVMDVWFDSGAMPFAQDHYPFENKNWVEGKGFPADYICEAIDQTRGWFYTLHAVGVLMGRGKAYKNVICLGHLLDANGKKMSKSIGNIVEPFEAMDKYGVDTLRLWMYSVNQPGESKNFDEKTVALLSQQVFGLLYNVLAFYELYRDKNLEDNVRPNSKNILDQWILARMDELIELMTKYMDEYKLLEPTRAMRDFIGDLSTWYLRRSRERIKEGDKEAKQTLYFILKTLARLMAPFAPFAGEDIWLKLKTAEDKESVHLEPWPKKPSKFFSFGKPKVLAEMEKVRDTVSALLKERQQKNIPVRQPLAEASGPIFSEIYAEIIKDEINIKEYKATGAFALDTNITPALKAEGDYREFMRSIQEKRKKLSLAPSDKMPLPIEAIYKIYKTMPNLQEHMLRVAAVASLICDNLNEPLDKENIVLACLLHDMGNIIKFKLDAFPEFLKPEGLEYWQKVKSEYIEKYGSNEYTASIEIAKELHVSDRVLDLIKSISFLGASDNAEKHDFGKKIVEYCDDRVDPFGIVSLEKRLTDLSTRYAHRDKERGPSFREAFEKAVRLMEKQIFSNCKIKPEDITDETVKPVILELRNFVIHS